MFMVFDKLGTKETAVVMLQCRRALVPRCHTLYTNLSQAEIAIEPWHVQAKLWGFLSNKK